jgi:hypothetical protein
VEHVFGQVVFSVGDSTYRWEDVVLAAELWGDWARLRDSARQAAACLLREDEEEEDPVSDEAVESAADEFRYARDLVSAEEMEAWLGRWGLTAEAWMDWIRSSVLRRKWSDELADLLSDYEPSEEDVEDLLVAEAVCSGALERLAYRLAGLAAVDGRERAMPADRLLPDESDLAATVREFSGRLSEKGVQPLMVAADPTKLERMARLELSFRGFRQRMLTPAAVDRELRSHRTEWTRLECHCVSFPREEQAREAALCVREDGSDLAKVAAGAGAPMRAERILLGEVAPEVQERFLGARGGDLVGPVQLGEEFVLYAVLDVAMPSEGDPADRRRVEEAILKRLVDREINDRVRWAAPLGVEP